MASGLHNRSLYKINYKSTLDPSVGNLQTFEQFRIFKNKFVNSGYVNSGIYNCKSFIFDDDSILTQTKSLVQDCFE